MHHKAEKYLCSINYAKIFRFSLMPLAGVVQSIQIVNAVGNTYLPFDRAVIARKELISVKIFVSSKASVKSFVQACLCKTFEHVGAP